MTKTTKKAPDESEKHPLRRFVYCGRRYRPDNAKMFDTFVEIEDGKRVDKHDYHAWSASRQQSFIIGGVYDGRCSKTNSVWFHTFELQGHTPQDIVTGVSQDEPTQWSLLDTAARLTKTDAATSKRLIKESREYWRECMGPIRHAYLNANAAERRGIRSLLIDDLLRA